MSPLNFAVHVLFEDRHLLAVNKPAGLLVQGDATGRPNLLDLAKDYIKIKYQKPGRVFLGLVHRLDRQVAGVVVFARTSKAAARLSAQFRGRQTRKIYWAVVHGRPSPPEGHLENILVKEGRRSVPFYSEEPHGKPARLGYRTIGLGPTTSLLEIVLETGRRHQIRAQLAALGHPICGDRAYGSPLDAVSDSIGLLSRSLTIKHPTRGDELIFEASPPDDWWWLPLK